MTLFTLGNSLLFKKVPIYLFLAELGLCCCAQAFSSCHTWAQQLWHVNSRARHMALVAQRVWDLLGPGIKPLYVALAGGFLIIGLPRKSRNYLLLKTYLLCASFLDSQFCEDRDFYSLVHFYSFWAWQLGIQLVYVKSISGIRWL